MFCQSSAAAIREECCRDFPQNSRYAGKYISILGDSISTLAGYNPAGYKVFYEGERCSSSGVHTPQDTWWGQVIAHFGAQLLVNNSWSGSRVIRLPTSRELFPSGCSDERTGGLHRGAQQPDVILVFLGTNDWGFGANPRLGYPTLSQLRGCTAFDYAYDRMLFRLRHNYPGAEIWCCTLCSARLPSDPSRVLPRSAAGYSLEEYNRIILHTAATHQCRGIDLDAFHLPYDSIDGVHPTASGMHTLASLMIQAMQA